MARPTVGVEPQTVRAVGMIEARKGELEATLNGGDPDMSPQEMEETAGVIRGLVESQAIIMLAVVTPEPQ